LREVVIIIKSPALNLGNATQSSLLRGSVEVQSSKIHERKDTKATINEMMPR